MIPPPIDLSDSSDDELVTKKNVVDESEEDVSYEEKDSDLEIAARGEQEEDEEERDFESERQEKFGLKGINDREGITKRLNEIRANFYNRLSS